MPNAESTLPGLGELLSRFMARNDLPAEDISELEAVSRSVDFAAGEAILREGAMNECLYFLIVGKIAILRSGERIATLSTPGDLLGEMSLITGKPCSATSLAEVDTQLLALEVSRLSTLPERLQAQLSQALDRLFSKILAQKLAATNEKARLFEITNRELEKAQKALELASSNRIDELQKNQRGLAHQITSLYREQLSPMRDQLEQLSRLVLAPGAKATLDEVARKLRRVLAEVEPVTHALQTERRMQEVKVLLAETDLDEQINARMSLGGTGVEFSLVSNAEECRKLLQEKSFDFFCLTAEFVSEIPLARSRNPGIRCVFMTSEPISKHFQTLRQHPELSTILARHPGDRSFTVKNTATTIRKLSGGSQIFGMEKYLAWGTELREFVVTQSDQRRELIQQMKEHLASIGIRNMLVSAAVRVAEELLMNAIYDAPADAEGRPIFNHLPRTVPVVLAPEQQARFRYACDGSFIAISVEDPFGAINRSTILDYLERCFAGVKTEQVANKGGGGNGLFQIIQSSSLTVFNVLPRTRTEVIALLNVNIQFNKISLHPSFHYFEA